MLDCYAFKCSASAATTATTTTATTTTTSTTTASTTTAFSCATADSQLCQFITCGQNTAADAVCPIKCKCNGIITG